MAIPTYVGAGTGATDAGGAWTYTGAAGTSGNLVILQVLQDGATASTVTLTSGTNIENLAGTDNTWTSIGVFNVGTAPAGFQHFWIGRLINTSAPTATGGNSGTDDIYMRTYEYSSVSAGTTLATVIENGTAGGTANNTGDGSTVNDADVTTLGPDRLALNFYAATDDIVVGTFQTPTGGTWSVQVQYATATGTDGALCMCRADMVTAGTIANGTVEQGGAGIPWGVTGFALIGTTAGVTLLPSPTNFGAHAIF